jgi:predicted peroxiredoxin
MARTIAQIQADIISSVQADPALSTLTSPSATAIWRAWTYVVAVAIATLENLWDVFRAETLDEIARRKPHTLRWYQQKALDFQYGSALVEGQDFYDNSALTPDQIAAQKIIAQAAASEENDRLIVKVAKEVSGELEPLDSTEYDAVADYFAEIKDAGVRLTLRSFNADKLLLTMDIYYEPTILGPSGARLDGSDNEPVQGAIRNYLRSLAFDGRFVKSHLVDALQNVEGVYVPEVRVCLAAKYDVATFTTVDIEYRPYSGFLRLYDESTDLNLTFIER